MVSSKIETLWTQLGPDTSAGASGTDALLNGLEIFKLGQRGDLSYPSKSSGSGGNASGVKGRDLWVGIGSGIASIALLAFLCTMFFYYCGQREKIAPAKNNPPGWCLFTWMIPKAMRKPPMSLKVTGCLSNACSIPVMAASFSYEGFIENGQRFTNVMLHVHLTMRIALRFFK